MKKIRVKRYVPILFLFVFSAAYGEIDFERTVLIDHSNGVLLDYIPIDVENDGDLDFYVMSRVFPTYVNDFYLYENNEGVYTPHLLESWVNAGLGFYDSGDIDNDGDVDIFALYFQQFPEPTIPVLIRNEGNWDYSIEEIEEEPFDTGFTKIIDIDLDGDEDLVFGTSYFIYYQESIDGVLSDSLTQLICSDSSILSNTIRFIDSDEDGDLDIFVFGEHFRYFLLYFENTGNLNFEYNEVSDTYETDSIGDIVIADMDQDQDLDVVSIGHSSDDGGDLSIWINDEGYFTQVILNTDYGELNPLFILCDDLDNDNDIDLISTAIGGYGFSIWENLGDLNFSTQSQTGYFFPDKCYTLDYDNDGDIDILYDRSGISLMVNQLYSSVDEQEIPETYEILSVYPNPFNTSANISVITQKEGNLEISLYNLLGQKVTTLTNRNYPPGKHFFSLDGNNLNSGTYFIQARMNLEQAYSQKITILK